MLDIYQRVRSEGLVPLLRDLNSRSDREEVVTVVVAALELVRLRGVFAEQRKAFAEIYLRLGERVGALVLDGVLGGQHQEGPGQREGLVADGDLLFLHGLQQRALHLGRRAVDLVRQDDVREHGALLDRELGGLTVEDGRSGHVGREQVGGELDPLESGVQGLGQGADRQGLGQAGHPLEQDVAAGQQAQQQAIEEAIRKQDSLDALGREQERILQRRKDSIRQMEEAALELRRKQDSIRQAEEAAIALKEDVVPEKGEKYQEVSQEEGLQPGFYLIANVFGTKRYYDIFMQRLQDRGLEPKSFYRSANKFNYVYLGRYSSIEEARKARDSQFGGR